MSVSIPGRITDKKVINKMAAGVDKHLDVFGKEYVDDTRTGDCAGKVAADSGNNFENLAEKLLKQYNKPVRYRIIKNDKYTCCFNLPRRIEFSIEYNCKKNVKKIYIECKQLGDLHSHFDKLCFNFLNFMYGCYGSEFWLIYDYNREFVNRKQCHKDKIESLISMVKIHNSYNTDKTFKLIPIEKLPYYLKNYLIPKVDIIR
tara:strand:- start:143 stop:748 length:606 start_codon:yes stop_codon:yes gene_type:complete